MNVHAIGDIIFSLFVNLADKSVDVDAHVRNMYLSRKQVAPLRKNSQYIKFFDHIYNFKMDVLRNRVEVLVCYLRDFEVNEPESNRAKCM